MIEALLKANGRKIRNQGTIYRITATNLGGRTLAEVAPIYGGGASINLMKSKTMLAKDLKRRIEMGLVS